jgi:hypothetical protein
MIDQNITDPLFHPGWINFNELQWGVKAEKLVFEPDKGNSWRLETIVYRNKKGKLVNPPRNPHLPVHFECTSEKPARVNRRKRMALEQLAAFYRKNRFGSSITLSPVADDLRPFTWQGMAATPRYTYHIDIANFAKLADSNVLNKSRKAKKLGYTCEITLDFQAVQECLNAPEARLGFEHRVNAAEMKRLHELVGDNNFAAFLCRDSAGRPQGAWVSLFVPNGWAMAWSAGVKSAALKDGANNLLGEYALEFLAEKGCTIFDFVGANNPPVARMKEAWGGDLVCYFTVNQRNFRYLAKEAYFTLKGFMKR